MPFPAADRSSRTGRFGYPLLVEQRLVAIRSFLLVSRKLLARETLGEAESDGIQYENNFRVGGNIGNPRVQATQGSRENATKDRLRISFPFGDHSTELRRIRKPCSVPQE